jgi:hypothetical protein
MLVDLAAIALYFPPLSARMKTDKALVTGSPFPPPKTDFLRIAAEKTFLVAETEFSRKTKNSDIPYVFSLYSKSRKVTTLG